jgi:hypothetical protein
MSGFALAEIPAKPDFKEKLTALRGFLQAEHVPPRVKESCLCLSEHQLKLFLWVPDAEAALESGACDPFSSLYATDFLNELLAAFTAFDWPQVIVLVHGLSSDNSSALPIGEGR